MSLYQKIKKSIKYISQYSRVLEKKRASYINFNMIMLKSCDIDVENCINAWNKQKNFYTNVQCMLSNEGFYLLFVCYIAMCISIQKKQSICISITLYTRRKNASKQNQKGSSAMQLPSGPHKKVLSRFFIGSAASAGTFTGSTYNL